MKQLIKASTVRITPAFERVFSPLNFISLLLQIEELKNCDIYLDVGEDGVPLFVIGDKEYQMTC